HDPEFSKLFKVAADFDDVIEREPENDQLFARLIASLCRQENLLHMDRSAVARAIERAARNADDSEKLSIVFGPLADVIREADFLARETGDRLIGAAHIDSALEAQVHRHDRIRERSHESITRDIILIDTEGYAVGQANALSVLQVGDTAFGKPSRITARVRMGTAGARLIDIEREVDLGGPLHSKGVMILGGYLAGQFLPHRPMSLSASLVFEQSYGGVDGDSASSAELYTLLSALSGVPIHQGLAVTGSVNQFGEVQPIGGVNEKIEGFFEICQQRGLTGDQGVLIPASNVKHLMLRQDVVDAVERGMFSVYPIERIEEGIELLTGLRAGKRGVDGRFPLNTIFQRVEERLHQFGDATAKTGSARANKFGHR
ncbi:MAG: AAA family ATPase, partial [Parvibaculaceae bacterium]|nr:AAA family ATPase [Parvibaculaceae bacterium]